MFTNMIISIGWAGLVVAIAYFVFKDQTVGTNEIGYIETTKDILIASIGVILAGYVLKYLGSLFGVNKNRCKKCGRRIDKTEMYCFDHRREAIWRAQEHDKTLGTRIR